MVALKYITEEERQKVAVWLKQLDRSDPELTGAERLRWISLLSPDTKAKFRTGSGIIEYWIQSFNAQLMKNLALGPQKKIIAKTTAPKVTKPDPHSDSDDPDAWDDIFAEPKEKKEKDKKKENNNSSDSDNPTPWDIFD